MILSKPGSADVWWSLFFTKHSHFTANALQSCFDRQRQSVPRFRVKLARLRGWSSRLRMKQFNQAQPTHFDLDAIGLEVDAADECHQHRAGLVRRHGWKLVCKLATASD
jgi:hypothetical protein